MNTKSLPPISESEWKVMEVVWDCPPKTAQDIIESLSSSCDWSPKTIKTLIFRLVKKEVLTHESKGREYSYCPLIEKSSYISQESESFLQRLFGGATAPMVAHLVRNRKISAREAKEIKRLLNEIEGESE